MLLALGRPAEVTLDSLPEGAEVDRAVGMHNPLAAGDPREGPGQEGESAGGASLRVQEKRSTGLHVGEGGIRLPDVESIAADLVRQCCVLRCSL